MGIVIEMLLKLLRKFIKSRIGESYGNSNNGKVVTAKKGV